MSRRSEITVDLGALRRNVARMREAAAPAEVWAVVKADAYGHGAIDCARAAVDAGAAALCVVAAQEGAVLRAALPDARILVMAPLAAGEDEIARAERLEIAVSSVDVPEGLPLHLKVDTGMGRWGMSAEEARSVRRASVVGVMSHFATAEEDDQTYARAQIARFTELVHEFDGVTAHMANSAATLSLPDARFDAVRCGLAIYGVSPYEDGPARHGLEPVLSWRSYLTLVKRVVAGESVGYGRRFVAERPTRVGIVPVGYADGFRRGLTGTEVLVDGSRRRVVGAVSMDALAVELGEEDKEGAPVTLIGDGVLAEEHARVLGAINHEITCGIRSDPARADRIVRGG